MTPTRAGAPARVGWRPHSAALTVHSSVTTGPKGSAIELASAVGGDVITIEGTVPVGHAPVLHVQQIPDPPAFARAALIEALRRAGVQVDASTAGDNPTGLLPAPGSYRPSDRVASYVSPPFSQYGRLILKVSLNMGANLSVCLLAVHSGSRDCLDGLAGGRSFLVRAGVDPGQVALSDGQGGSPTDLVTPRAVVGLLSYFSTRPDFTLWTAALPIMGVDGSLVLTDPRSPAAGRVFAKTGTLISGDLLNQRLLLSTNGFAGYIDARDGQPLAFGLYVNNVPLASPLDLFKVNDVLGGIATIIWAAPNAGVSHQ